MAFLEQNSKKWYGRLASRTIASGCANSGQVRVVFRAPKVWDCREGRGARPSWPTVNEQRRRIRQRRWPGNDRRDERRQSVRILDRAMGGWQSTRSVRAVGCSRCCSHAWRGEFRTMPSARSASRRAAWRIFRYFDRAMFCWLMARAIARWMKDVVIRHNHEVMAPTLSTGPPCRKPALPAI